MQEITDTKDERKQSLITFKTAGKRGRKTKTLSIFEAKVYLY